MKVGIKKEPPELDEANVPPLARIAAEAVMLTSVIELVIGIENWQLISIHII